MSHTISFGQLNLSEHFVQRSGLRWIASNGQHCKQGAPLAYCNILIIKKGGSSIFKTDESRDLQVVFLCPASGTLKIGEHTSFGGIIDQRPYYFPWDEHEPIGQLTQDVTQPSSNNLAADIVFTVGRRYANFAENRNGLSSGWFQSTRSWKGDCQKITRTLLALGSCEIINTLRGDQIANLDALNLLPGNNQIIVVPDGIHIPSATIIHEQINRSAVEYESLATNFSQSIKALDTPCQAEDYLFYGDLLSSLARNLVFEKNVTFTRSGEQEHHQVDVVITSLMSQQRRIFRNKALGYSIAIHDWRINELGNHPKEWLRDNFESITRGPNQIGESLKLLSQSLGPKVRLLVANLPPNPKNPPITKYDQFDSQTFHEIWSVSRHEHNVMLDDLADQGFLEVIDLEAMCAEYGVAENVPDGVHMSNAVQLEVVREIGRTLQTRAQT